MVVAATPRAEPVVALRGPDWAPMVAAALLTLLEVQDLDTSADQLTRRRETMSLREQLAAATAEGVALQAELEGVAARAHDLDRVQRRLEDEVASLADKAAATDRQLYSGTVTAPRELQALQDEAASLRRRTTALEDELLEVMEALEPVTAALEHLRGAQRQASERAEQLRNELDAAVAAIDGELLDVAASRQALAAGISPELLARYERIRARAGGVGIARLDGHRCTGCHLVLPNREVDELRRLPADEVVLHDECGRILVRD